MLSINRCRVGNKRKLGCLKIRRASSSLVSTYSCYLDVVVGLACCNDPKGCTGWNIRSFGFNLVREAEGEQPDKKQRVLVL